MNNQSMNASGIMGDLERFVGQNVDLSIRTADDADTVVSGRLAAFTQWGVYITRDSVSAGTVDNFTARLYPWAAIHFVDLSAALGRGTQAA